MVALASPPSCSPQSRPFIPLCSSTLFPAASHSPIINPPPPSSLLPFAYDIRLVTTHRRPGFTLPSSSLLFSTLILRPPNTSIPRPRPRPRPRLRLSLPFDFIHQNNLDLTSSLLPCLAESNNVQPSHQPMPAKLA